MSDKKKKIRSKFREDCFARDKHVCKVCGGPGPLDAHHITDRNEMPNGGYVKENGISLCEACHIAAEHFHITGGVEWPGNFHPNDLYKLIGSSKEKAIKASEGLK